MRFALPFFMLLIPLISLTQTLRELSGSWVRILETGYEAGIRQKPPIEDKDYLKVRFGADGQMTIYSHYAANGVQVPYQTNGDILNFGPTRKLKIEKQTDDLLVLIDLIDEEVTNNSTRHYYLRESIFLDGLPYPLEDRVILGKDTAYLASKKLYPIFQTTDTPDFHIFIHNQIKSSYAIGENYFHATFMIRPDGSIDHISINHRISKVNDKRAIKAIEASLKRWRMPQLNGRDVNIIMTIEDLFTRRSENASSQSLKLDFDYNNEAPQVYQGYFNLAMRNMLTLQPQKALEYLKHCEERRPDDPNLHYLRYRLYTAMKNQAAADKNLAKVKRSKLRYLVR